MSLLISEGSTTPTDVPRHLRAPDGVPKSVLARYFLVIAELVDARYGGDASIDAVPQERSVTLLCETPKPVRPKGASRSAGSCGHERRAR